MSPSEFANNSCGTCVLPPLERTLALPSSKPREEDREEEIALGRQSGKKKVSPDAGSGISLLLLPLRILRHLSRVDCEAARAAGGGKVEEEEVFRDGGKADLHLEHAVLRL